MPPNTNSIERGSLAFDSLVQTAVKEVARDLLPPSVARRDIRPIKVERRAALLRSIARGRAWLDAVVSGVATVEDIARRHRCGVRHVNMTISMAFIAPGLVKAAVEGRLPRGIGIANLRDAPAEGRFNLRGSGWLTLKSPSSRRSSVQNSANRFHFS